MSSIDWCVLSAYFVLMLGMGLWARTKVKTASDFFTAGGAMPWWLSGISHHMSGYSSAVFVGFAAIAYTAGFSLYIWWACSICLALVIGSSIFPGRWSRMRQTLGIISPLEFLVARYNLPTQQLLAWSGAVLKIFDVGAKWTAAAILLQVFAHVQIVWGVLLTGTVTLVYSVVGGLWADALTDLSQFVIQIFAGTAMLPAGARLQLPGSEEVWVLAITAGSLVLGEELESAGGRGAGVSVSAFSGGVIPVVPYQAQVYECLGRRGGGQAPERQPLQGSPTTHDCTTEPATPERAR